MTRTAKLLVLALIALVFALPAAGCGRERPADEAATEETDTGAFAEEDLSGTVRADGSSTVGPYVTYAAEQFQKQEPGVRVTVGVSGTGGGFERFCRGETDVSNASRPIKDEEIELCEKEGIDYTELQIANDGLSVVVNPKNDWADCLSGDQLKKIWQPGSKVDNWKEVDASFPDVKLTLYGAGTDSGTFDYFTDAINGEEGASRSDYTATEDDNVTVTGVAGERGALGYFGLSYFESNRGKLKGVKIDGGGGCVEPTSKTVQDGTYKPLSRPLFVYAKSSALERLEVDAFLQFMLDNQERIARAALFVPLTDDQLAKSRTQLEAGSTDVE
jgi:phosphate transport system substrate-binding protein